MADSAIVLVIVKQLCLFNQGFFLNFNRYCMMVQRSWLRMNQTRQSMKYLLITRFKAPHEPPPPKKKNLIYTLYFGFIKMTSVHENNCFFRPKSIRVENENSRNKHQFLTVPELPALGTDNVTVVIFCLISFVKSSNCNVINRRKEKGCQN